MLPRFYPRKSQSYRQALQYCLREQVNHGFVITHNIQGQTWPEWVREFQQNESKRSKKSQRKNAVRLRHIVLPWSGKDKITNEAMEDMTREFMRLYNPHAVYVAVAHEPDDKHPHPHVHIVAGGTDKFGRALNLQDKDRLDLFQRAEAYQREHYPEYVYSQVEHKGRRQSRKSRGEYWIKRRGKELYKEKIQPIIEKVFRIARSPDDFIAELQKEGLDTYTYRGKVVGIKVGKYKLRFRLFGIGKERMRELEGKTKDRSLTR